MGSPYLMAHGLGTPVADAETTVTFPEAGTYRLWVRTKNWVEKFDDASAKSSAPGRFQVVIDGQAVETEFGTKGADWHWQDGGQVNVAGTSAKLALHDLTGFNGRCDAILFASDPNFTPDNSIEVLPVQGAPLGRPVVSADGRNLVITFPSGALQPTQRTATLNVQQPGRVPQTSFAPPLQPRAVAPPLGDMAVGSMVLRNQSYVNVSGPNVTLTLRNAPAKDAVMSIAQLGGYGFVFVDDNQL